jgi:hypothetical protein
MSSANRVVKWHWTNGTLLRKPKSNLDSHIEAKRNLGPKKRRQARWACGDMHMFKVHPTTNMTRLLKVGNWPDFLTWRQWVTYRWKVLNKGYDFALDLVAIRGLHAKLWAPKVTGVATHGILELPFGSPGTKSHLHVALEERCSVYYKGEYGGFPQVRAVVSLVSPSSHASF